MNKKMDKRKIKFKAVDSNTYIDYIDIGSCEKHYDSLPLFDENKTTYSNWLRNFKINKMGVQLLTLHYYLLEFNSDSKLPNHLNNNILDNIDFFKTLNKKWFNPNTPIFKSLDLNFEDIEDRVTTVRKNNDGTREEIQLDDGSRIIFLDDDDTVQSFYVTESEYSELACQVDSILEKLK